MYPNDVKRMIPAWFRARTPVYFRGPPGIGKTSIVMQAVPQLSAQFKKNLGIVVLNGGNLTVMDMMGYLVPKERDGVSISEFTKPFWWFTEEGRPVTDYDGGIIFVDEEDKAPLDVKKVLGEMKLSGRFGPHVLPKNWVVWGAGNRAEDRSGSTKDLDHLINRRVEINMMPHLQSWKDWAFKAGVNPIFIAYADQNSEVVFSNAVPKSQGPWCTPRSFVRIAEDLESMALDNGGNIPMDSLAQEHAAGGIGHGAVASLFSYIKLGQEMPSYHDIIAHPDTTKVPTRADAQMLVCFRLAAKVEEAEMGAVVTYIERMPKEFSVTFAKAACRRDADLLNTPAITRWCANNHSLMTAISGRD
jgi:hypothetical protein